MAKKVKIKNPNIKTEKAETADSWVDTREKMRRFTIDMPISLHVRLKIASAKSGETMAEIMCRLLDEKLE